MRNVIRRFCSVCASLVVMLSLVLSLVACSFMDVVSDWVNENPVVAQLATSQAVARYIEGGETAEDILKRRDDVMYVMSRTIEFIDTSTEVRADQIFNVFVAQVDWASLTVSDRILAVEAIRLVQDSIERRIVSGEMNEDTVLVLRGIIGVALDTARFF